MGQWQTFLITIGGLAAGAALTFLSRRLELGFNHKNERLKNDVQKLEELIEYLDRLSLGVETSINTAIREIVGKRHISDLYRESEHSIPKIKTLTRIYAPDLLSRANELHRLFSRLSDTLDVLIYGSSQYDVHARALNQVDQLTEFCAGFSNSRAKVIENKKTKR
ncbi:MAG: hypothetical protein KIS76_06575 [Pyrinomonadaceae bacterium]|nr:hypothetical protein [Pyrinomonadaceae bacterium]